MKRKLSLLVCLLFTLAQIPFVTFASDPYSQLSTLAREHIIVSQFGNQNEFSNLQAFYAVVNEELPEITDLQLAKFVLEYTGQTYSLLSEETILETLLFVSITVSDQLFRVSEDGTMNQIDPNMPGLLSDTWSDDDGYIQITTNTNKLPATANGIPHVVSSTARWLKKPIWRLTDTFAIVHGGIVDDSYPITSTFYQRHSCANCLRTWTDEGSEVYGSDGTDPRRHLIEDSEYLDLDYSDPRSVGVKVDILSSNCFHYSDTVPVNAAHTEAISVYLRFKVLVDRVTYAQAVYSHTQVGAAVDISGTVSTEGEVTISIDPSIFTVYELYSAPPVTLRIA